MRKNVEYKQVTKEVVTYVAYDGTVFNDEEACRKYENTAECAIEAAVNGITVRNCIGSDILDNGAPFCIDGFLRAFKIRDANDLEIVNRWILSVTKGDKSSCITANAIGKTIIFEEYEGYIYHWGDIDEMVGNFRQTLEKYLGEKQKDESKEEN